MALGGEGVRGAVGGAVEQIEDDPLTQAALAHVDDLGTWEPRELPLPRETVSEMRTELLEQAVRHFAPDLLVADLMPASSPA